LFIGHTSHRTRYPLHAPHTPRTGHHTHRPAQGQGSKNLTTYQGSPEPTDKSANNTTFSYPLRL